MMSRMNSIQVRVQKEVCERLDGLIPYIADETDLGVSKGEVTRSDAIRLALDTGIDTLERRAMEMAARRTSTSWRTRQTPGRS